MLRREYQTSPGKGTQEKVLTPLTPEPEQEVRSSPQLGICVRVEIDGTGEEAGFLSQE